MRGESRYVVFFVLTLALFMLVSSQLDPVSWVGPVEASPDPANTGTIVYGESTVATPRYRKWDGSALGSEQTGPTMGATIRYVVLKSNPIRNEKMLVVSEDAGDVFASVFYLGVWETVKTLGTAILSDAASRGFHVAYEQSTGDCMIVVRSSADVKYWSWDGLNMNWTANGATLDLTVTTGDPVWIRLAADPGSDDIAMIWLDNTYDVGGAIWDGSAWGNQLLLDGTSVTSEMVNTECIAVEYMANNGKAMFAWGGDDQPTVADSGIGSRVWNGASWDSALAWIDTGDDGYPPFWLSMKADPNHNRLMLAVIDDATDLNTVRWTATAWDSAVEHDNAIEPGGEDSRAADVEWETVVGHGGHAIVAWNSGDDALRVKHWGGSAWGSEILTDPYAALTDQHIIQLRRTGDDRIFVSMVDDDSDLHVWYWNTVVQTWTTSGSGLGEIELLVSGGILYEPFEFAPDIVDLQSLIHVKPQRIVDTSLGVGQTFTVDVDVAEFTGLYGADFMLAYDTSILTATSSDVSGNIFLDGEWSPDVQVWNNLINDTAGAGGPGKGRVWVTLAEGFGEPTGVSGSGHLTTITFSVDALGSTDLDIYFTEIVDVNSVDIPHSIQDGYFENAVPVPEFPLGAAIEITLAVAIAYIWWKRKGKVKISRTQANTLR